ncbi:MAG: hypothetical protein M1821_005046 [Bathelium mastoideum]|nr:MAG: hypothetical protein M1821_005046 [Bathelium mastoideum]
MSAKYPLPFPEFLSYDEDVGRNVGLLVARLASEQITTHGSQTSVSSNSQLTLSYPAIFASTNRDDKLKPGQPKNLSLLRSAQPSDLREFFEEELDVSRVDKLKRFLWLAGQKRQCRPLHQQVLAGRQIVLIETCHLHLMWIDTRLFIKPCPDFLLQYQAWKEHLTKDVVLYDSALGLLRSYVALVRRKSDLKIAQANGVLPETMAWPYWVRMSRAVLDMSNDNEGKWKPTKEDRNIRYQFGELRLSRINWIHRLNLWDGSPREPAQFQRGFLNGYYDYTSFFQRNMAWLATSTIYIVLVLTAMQVGLAADRLGDNRLFNNVSFGFVIFAIIAPLAIILLVFATLAFTFVDNLVHTLRRKKRFEIEVKDRGVEP